MHPNKYCNWWIDFTVAALAWKLVEYRRSEGAIARDTRWEITTRNICCLFSCMLNYLTLTYYVGMVDELRLSCREKKISVRNVSNPIVQLVDGLYTRCPGVETVEYRRSNPSLYVIRITHSQVCWVAQLCSEVNPFCHLPQVMLGCYR